MATALTADAMLAALRKWGIVPKFYRSNWRTHNRNAQQGWGPVNGFMVHNFGSDTSDPNSLAYLYNGDLARGMPGPLSQFAITDDGQVWVIGWGTANHGGRIDNKTHALVVRDAMPLDRDIYPTTNGSSPSSLTTAANPRYVGVEMTYGRAPTAAQRASCALLGAALMDALGDGYTGGSVVAHRESTTARSDPVGIPMGSLRRQINALLEAGPPGAEPTPAPVPEPAAPEDDMFSDADRALLQDTLKKADGSTIRNDLKWQNDQAAKLAGQVSGLTVALTSLAGGQGVDLDAVTAAAKAGAQAALDEKIAGATTTLEVTPPSA